jgi:hypothetical protein
VSARIVLGELCGQLEIRSKTGAQEPKEHRTVSQLFKNPRCAEFAGALHAMGSEMKVKTIRSTDRVSAQGHVRLVPDALQFDGDLSVETSGATIASSTAKASAKWRSSCSILSKETIKP